MKLITSIIVIAISAILHAQNIEAGEGESSIMNRKSEISLDLGDEEIELNITNYQKTVGKNAGFIFNGGLRGSNEKGRLSLFNNGYVNPKTTAGITIGGFFTNRNKLLKEINSDSLRKAFKDSLLDELEKHKSHLTMYHSVIMRNIENTYTSDTANRYYKNFIKEMVTFNPVNKIKGLSYDYYNEYFKLITSQSAKSVDGYTKSIWNVDYLQALKQVCKDSIKAFNELNARHHALNSNIDIVMIRGDFKLIDSVRNKTVSEKELWRVNVFATGGINSVKFKHFTALDSNNFENSFSKINQRGGFIGGGFNFEYGPYFVFGGRMDYIETTNFGSLDKTDFSYSTEFPSGMSTTAKTTEQITAYSGEFMQLFMRRISLDLIAKIHPSDNNYNFYPGLYFRYQEYNKPGSEKNPPTTDIGGSLSVQDKKGKFVGGLYLELTDINDHVEKLKETPQLRPTIQKFSFGLYTKLLIGRNWLNRE